MDTKKKLGLYIAIIVLVCIALFIVFRGKIPFNRGSEAVVDQPVVENTGEVGGTIIEPTIPTEPESRNLRRAAMDFAETFGSFSNESDYQNLKVLLGDMTPRMKAWAESVIAAGQSEGDFQITTRALSAEEVSYDEESGVAEYLVSTQRQEVENGASRVYYQDIQIIYKDVGAEWRVDQANWLEAAE